MFSMDEIGERLRTQDNRITNEPIFVVQRLVRDVGYDPNYQDDPDHITWFGPDGEVGEDKRKALDRYWRMFLQEPRDYTRTAFCERWEFVQPFFTEAAAKRYLEENAHNLRPQARVYAESAYRNKEWIAIRHTLMGDKVTA